MSEPTMHSWITKDVLMKYSLVGLCALAAISVFSWGIESIIVCIVSVLTAVTLDYLLSLVMKKKGPLDISSAAVLGLIVGLSYSLGIPSALYSEVFPLTAPMAYVFVALISAVTIVVFQKLQSLSGRKYINPAAAAKLLVFLPFFNEILLPIQHTQTLPPLTSAIGFSGSLSFGSYLQSCFANAPLVNTNMASVFYTLTVLKHHCWIGGASSIAVIAVGLVLFALCGNYFKWRITATYLVTVVLFALVLGYAYGGDPLLRVSFHLFIGSSIFLAFFMAIDSATTPLTYMGQGIFGAGLGILTVAIQTYMNFLGGSILALVAMNLTSPLLDNVGKMQPRTERLRPKLPRAVKLSKVKVAECINCGVCMRSCCHHLSPILIKKSFDAGNLKRAKKLQANLCEGCGSCNFVCPSNIDLKTAILRANAKLRRSIIT